MSQKSNFWKTGVGAGDSPTNWTESDFASRFRAELTDPTAQAVIKGKLNSLAVTGSSSPVSIASGQANVYGYWYENDAASTFAVASPVSSTRIDRIILRANMTESAHADGQAAKTVRIAKLTGAEGGAAPSLTQNASYWEIPLAQVTITTGGVITLVDQRSYVPQVGTNEPVPDMTAISTVAYIKGRQGSSPTDWGGSNGGNSNYTPTGAIKIQAGTCLPVYVSTATQRDVVVTFPVAFANVPIVVATTSYPNSPSGYDATGTQVLIAAVSATQVTIRCTNATWTSGTPGTQIVNWIAIGP